MSKATVCFSGLLGVALGLLATGWLTTGASAQTPVGWWRMEGGTPGADILSVVDSSANGFDATGGIFPGDQYSEPAVPAAYSASVPDLLIFDPLTGNTTANAGSYFYEADPEGRIDRALVTSSGSALSMHSLAGDAFTFEMFIRREVGSNIRIFSDLLDSGETGGTTSGGFELENSGGGSNLNFYIYGDTSGETGAATNHSNDDLWHHIAFTYDGATRQLSSYLDYTLQNTKTTTAYQNSLNDNPLLFGVKHGSSIDTYLDELRYTSGILSPGDFLQAVPAPPPLLTLEVNTDTGAVAIQNDTSGMVDIDFYEIKSGDGSLNLGVGGWNSFDDQNVDHIGPGSGESWDAAGGSNANHVSEFFLLGGSDLDPAESMSLGNLFSPAGDTGQLEFRFGRTDGPGTLAGIIELVTGGGIDGDFDNDGDVDGADFLLWQRGGSPGGLGSGDLALWQANFGSPALAASAVAVPEPATGVLLLCGGLVLLFGCRGRA